MDPVPYLDVLATAPAAHSPAPVYASLPPLTRPRGAARENVRGWVWLGVVYALLAGADVMMYGAAPYSSVGSLLRGLVIDTAIWQGLLLTGFWFRRDLARQCLVCFTAAAVIAEVLLLPELMASAEDFSLERFLSTLVLTQVVVIVSLVGILDLRRLTSALPLTFSPRLPMFTPRFGCLLR